MKRFVLVSLFLLVPLSAGAPPVPNPIGNSCPAVRVPEMTFNNGIPNAGHPEVVSAIGALVETSSGATNLPVPTTAASLVCEFWNDTLPLANACHVARARFGCDNKGGAWLAARLYELPNITEWSADFIVATDLAPLSLSGRYQNEWTRLVIDRKQQRVVLQDWERSGAHESVTSSYELK